uniref:gonadotropin-releasing hormone II receptor-like n=1 Tax=Pristiophorus japonicus TaxID=55135 RepID=UPI00398EBEF4
MTGDLLCCTDLAHHSLGSRTAWFVHLGAEIQLLNKARYRRIAAAMLRGRAAVDFRSNVRRKLNSAEVFFWRSPLPPRYCQAAALMSNRKLVDFLLKINEREVEVPEFGRDYVSDEIVVLEPLALGAYSGNSDMCLRHVALRQTMTSTNQSERIPILEFDGLNVSPAAPEPWIVPAFTVAARLRVIVTFCFFILSMFSNTAVLLSVIKKRRKSHIRILILSLTLADLMVTVLVMPLDAVWNITIQWYAGDAACRALNFLKLFAMYASALVLVVISIDRHSAILDPFSFTRASHRNKVLLSMAWIASMLLAAPQLFIFQVRNVHGMNFTQCVTYGSFTEHWHETFYNMFTFITLYVTPLTVMLICYTRILWEISKQMKENRGERSEATLSRMQNDYILKARMKTLKMTIVIVVSFIICWTPYYLLGLWYWFKPDILKNVPEYVNHILFLFALLHTCSDPVIYGFYTPSFRKDVRTCWGGVATGVTRLEGRHAGKPATVKSLQGGINGKVLNHVQMVSVVCNGTAQSAF